MPYNKHIKRCPVSSGIREMQIQDHNEILCHMQIEKIYFWTTAHVNEDVEQWKLTSTSGGGLNVYHYFGKLFGIAQKSEHLVYDPKLHSQLYTQRCLLVGTRRQYPKIHICALYSSPKLEKNSNVNQL